jgi:SAM-dependent methyltransferase
VAGCGPAGARAVASRAADAGPLARAIRQAIAADVAPGGPGQRVLDVGCGSKPYAPWFADIASDYVGVDARRGPYVDVVAAAESLPLASSSFDVVLSTQTLEHVPEPAAAVREMHRVLKAGGVLLLSTHGTAVYHPGPGDFWRWTQEGLPKLVNDNGAWRELRLESAGGTFACFGYLFGFYLDAALRGPALAPLRRPLVALVNVTFGALDRAVPLRPPRRHTLISNFLVIARKE